MISIRRWLAASVVVLLGACRDGAVTQLDRAKSSANIDVGVQAGDLDVNPYYLGTAVPSLQLTACGVTAQARHLGNNTQANQFWWCNLPTFVNLTPGEYEVKLSFGPNQTVPMAHPSNATVVAGSTSVLDMDTETHVGMLTGSITLNGAMPSNLTVCVTTGQSTMQQMQQCGSVGQFSGGGAFKFLVPGTTGVLEIKSQSFATLYSLPFTGVIGQTTHVGNIDVALGDLDVNALYLGEEVQQLGLTMCGVSAHATHQSSNATSNQFWWCNLPVFQNLNAGAYDVRLSFGPNQTVPLSGLHNATVSAGAQTVLNIDVAGHAGIVTGKVTENGVVTSQMTVCVTTGQGTMQQMQQCGGTGTFNGGVFKFLVPPGAGLIELKSQSFQTILSQPFTGTVGTAVDVGTLNVAVGDLAVKALYDGQEMQTLQLTMCGVTAHAKYLATGAESGQFWWCSLPTFQNLTPGAYLARLSFGPNQSVPMSDPVATSVTAGTTTNLSIDTKDKVGLLTGTVTLNGQPGTNLQVCLTTGQGTMQHMQQCGSVMSHQQGRFKFLVPPGCGTGTVRGPSFNLLAEFPFCLDNAGEEEDVGNPVEPSDNTPPSITPTITGTLGSNNWYTSDVSVSWSVTDAESDVTTPACPTSSVTANTTAGGVTFTCTATSTGGTDTKSVTIKRDASAPTIVPTVTGTLGSNGWYTSDVEIAWATSDDESGIASSSGCALAGVLNDVDAAAFTCTATNAAALSASRSVSVKRDATVPALSFAGNLGSYAVDQMVSITCSASDAMSQLASTACPSLSKAAYELPLGTNTLSATATDNAGNSASATTSFTVAATSESVCSLVERWVANKGVANSLCVKLRNGSLKAFQNELSAQAGKHVPEDKAAILASLSTAL